MARTPEIGEAREDYLRVRLAPSESLHLDRSRGEQSRSDFVRGLISAYPGAPAQSRG